MALAAINTPPTTAFLTRCTYAHVLSPHTQTHCNRMCTRVAGVCATILWTSNFTLRVPFIWLFPLSLVFFVVFFPLLSLFTLREGIFRLVWVQTFKKFPRISRSDHSRDLDRQDSFAYRICEIWRFWVYLYYFTVSKTTVVIMLLLRLLWKYIAPDVCFFFAKLKLIQDPT